MEPLKSAYGYAIFPALGRVASLSVAMARSGDEKGKNVGTTSMTQVTVGAQIGGQAYSQIVFSRINGRSKSRPAATSSRSRGVGRRHDCCCRSKGWNKCTSIGASGGAHDAKATGAYKKGMVTFTVAKVG